MVRIFSANCNLRLLYLDGLHTEYASFPFKKGSKWPRILQDSVSQFQSFQKRIELIYQVVDSIIQFSTWTNI